MRFIAIEVDGRSSEFEDLNGGLILSVPFLASQQRTHTGDQLIEVKGFCEIVICTGFKALNGLLASDGR